MTFREPFPENLDYVGAFAGFDMLDRDKLQQPRLGTREAGSIRVELGGPFTPWVGSDLLEDIEVWIHECVELTMKMLLLWYDMPLVLVFVTSDGELYTPSMAHAFTSLVHSSRVNGHHTSSDEFWTLLKGSTLLKERFIVTSQGVFPSYYVDGKLVYMGKQAHRSERQAHSARD